LLLGLTRKELQVKYKNSVVGIGWSMLNPAFVLVVYFFVFQVVLGNGLPGFAIYLMSGLLVWNLFAAAVPSATGSIVGNSSIVKKVSFPREILALAAVGANLLFFCYQLIVLALFLVIFRYVPTWRYVPLLVVALVTLLVFTSAVGVFFAAVNVKYRDTQHFLDIVLQAWFWATPIVYPYEQIAGKLGRHAWLYRLNPITPIVLTFQRTIYSRTDPYSTHGPIVNGHRNVIHVLPHNGIWWYGSQLLVLLGISVVLFLGALVVFGRLEGNFAEEL